VTATSPSHLRLHVPGPTIVSDREVASILSNELRRRRKPDQRRLRRALRTTAFLVWTESLNQEAEFSLDLGCLAHRFGSSTSEVARQLEQLVDGGVLETLRVAAGTRYRWPEHVLQHSAGADGVRWDVVVERLAGDPAALLVVRALVDLLTPPFNVHEPLAYAEIAAATEYERVRVGEAVESLVGAGIVDRRRDGRVYQLRLADDVRTSREPAGSVQGGMTAGVSPLRPRPEPIAQVPTLAPVNSIGVGETRRPPPVPDTSAGCTVRLYGQTLSFGPGSPISLGPVPDGVEVEIRFDPQGRPTLRIGDDLEIGPR
jgi:DNA-binding transcriptional ArsR family regulator